MKTRVLMSIAAALTLAALAIGSAEPPDKATTSSTSDDTPSSTAQPGAAPAAPAPEPVGKWSVVENVDPMTDTTSTTAVLEWDVRGWMSKPSIKVRCKDRKIEVIYDFQESLTRTSLRGGFDPKATFRWDDGSPEDRTFSDAEGVSTAMFSYQAKPDAKRLMAHKRLRIQFVAGLGGKITNLDADLTGSPAAIGRVVEACAK